MKNFDLKRQLEQDEFYGKMMANVFKGSVGIYLILPKLTEILINKGLFFFAKYKYFVFPILILLPSIGGYLLAERLNNQGIDIVDEAFIYVISSILLAYLLYLPYLFFTFKNKFGGRITTDIISNQPTKMNRIKTLIKNKNNMPIGVSMENNEPIGASQNGRTEHFLVAGVSGSGKTSALLNMIRYDIFHENPVIFIDPKGEKKTLDTLKDFLKRCGRDESDLLVFDFAEPGKSAKYNPLKHGTPSQKTSKIMSALGGDHDYWGAKASNFVSTLTTICELLDLDFSLELLENAIIDETYRSELVDRVLELESNYIEKLEVKLTSFQKAKYQDLDGIHAKVSRFNALELDNICSPSLDFYKQIDLVNVLNGGKIAYFRVYAPGREEECKYFGRLIIEDLKVITSLLESEKVERKFSFGGFYLDEFKSFADKNFSKFLLMARSCNLGAHIFMQSPEGIKEISKDLHDDILENTAYKLVFQQQTRKSIETWAELTGTSKILDEKTVKFGNQSQVNSTQKVLNVEMERSNLDYNVLRNLNRGEAVFIDRHSKKNSLVKIFHGSNEMFLGRNFKKYDLEKMKRELEERRQKVIMERLYPPHGYCPDYIPQYMRHNPDWGFKDSVNRYIPDPYEPRFPPK